MSYTENEIFNLVNGSEVTGESPYALWKSLGNEGTAQDFLNYLKDDGESNVSEEVLAQIEKNKEDIIKLQELIGSSTGSSSAIMDVTSLPTENINKGCIYRLMTGTFVYNKEKYESWTVKCVNELPENPEPVSRDFEKIYSYYNTQDGIVYGYVDDAVASAAGGIPAGWYTLEQLAPAFDLTWEGVITHMDDSKEDDSWRVLLSCSLFIYQDGWKELPYVYEAAPKFDITWDGEFGDKFSLDMSALGFPNMYMVKVSNDVFTTDELIDATYTQYSGYECELSEDLLNSDSYPGAIQIDGGGIMVLYSSDDTNAALGLPAGYLTNGTYFIYMSDYSDGEPNYTNRLVAKKKITKIDSKFIDANTSSDVDLTNYVTITQAQDMIANAIGNAIGGSY